jgi:hypothetical protein
MSKSAMVPILIAGVIVGACLGVYVLGQYVQRRLQETSPRSRYLQQITGTAIIPPIVFVAVLLAATIVFHISPSSAIGSFLHAWYGWVTVIACGYAATIVTNVVLLALGFPIKLKGAGPNILESAAPAPIKGQGELPL